MHTNFDYITLPHSLDVELGTYMTAMIQSQSKPNSLLITLNDEHDTSVKVTLPKEQFERHAGDVPKRSSMLLVTKNTAILCTRFLDNSPQEPIITLQLTDDGGDPGSVEIFDKHIVLTLAGERNGSRHNHTGDFTDPIKAMMKSNEDIARSILSELHVRCDFLG